MCWPALWNGYPLLFPDSIDYLGSGHGITLVLRGIPTPAFMATSMRSEIFAAGIFLLHWRTTLWPIVVLQAALTGWVLWLVVRSLCRRPLPTYVVLTLLLCVFTSAAWYASFIMADIFGPLLYLSLYLLMFAPESLARWEQVALCVLACWAAASHSTHLILALFLCAIFAVLLLVRCPVIHGRGRHLLRVAAMLLLAVAMQVAVHARIYGRPSLWGEPPPFVMARLLGDGPARLYLQQHCAALSWTICSHVRDLPVTEGDLLWKPGGIWQTATQAQREALRTEQMPLLLATLQSYPLQQSSQSWRNFVRLLVATGPDEFWHYDVFTPRNLEFALPGLSQRYPLTKQSRSAMPQMAVRSIQGPFLLVCILAILALLPWFWRRGDLRLLGLASIVLVVVPMNALLCGVVSMSASRLQDRVDWMLALLAGVMVSIVWTARAEAQAEAATRAPGCLKDASV